MTDNKQKPKLRNKSYDGEWVKQTLGDICKRYDNLRIPVTSTSRILGNIPYYGANGIQDYVSDCTHNGEYILIAEDGANNLVDYPVRYVNGKFWANNHVHVISAIGGISSNKFLTYAIPKSDIKPHLVGGDRSKLTSEALMKLDIYQPTSIKEQESIGDFFIHIDDYLEKEASYTTKLEASKKSLLQKMFPEGNNDKPSLRFKGFTDAWEQRDVGDCLVSIPSKNFIAEAKPSGKYPVYQQGDISLAGYSNISPFRQENVILFGDHTLSLYRPEKPFLLATDGIKILKSNNFNNLFFKYYLEKYKPKSEGYKRHYGILIKKASYYTKSKTEQEKIGSIINYLDTLITLHQRKFEKLQNIKKSLLERMFI